MKIADIRAFPLRISKSEEASQAGDYRVDHSRSITIYSPHHETTVIRVETDNGIVGWGEAQSPVSPNTTATIVRELVRPLVMGRDPFDIEAIWTCNYDAMRERGHLTGFYIDALAGTDIALWDVVGKAIGKPVHKIAGGRYREEILLYAGIGGTDPVKVADAAEEHVGYGYQALKLHLLSDVESVAEICRAVRQRVGPGIMLMVDTHMRQTVSSSIMLGRELEKLNFTWLEAPIIPDDIPGQAEITRALDMAGGDRGVDAHSLRDARAVRAPGVRHFDARHRADGDYRGASDCDAGRHLQHSGRAACRRGWDLVGGGDRRVVGVVSELHDHGAHPSRQRDEESDTQGAVRTGKRLLQGYGSTGFGC